MSLHHLTSLGFEAEPLPTNLPRSSRMKYAASAHLPGAQYVTLPPIMPVQVLIVRDTPIHVAGAHITVPQFIDSGAVFIAPGQSCTVQPAIERGANFYWLTLDSANDTGRVDPIVAQSANRLRGSSKPVAWIDPWLKSRLTNGVAVDLVTLPGVNPHPHQDVLGEALVIVMYRGVRLGLPSQGVVQLEPGQAYALSANERARVTSSSVTSDSPAMSQFLVVNH